VERASAVSDAPRVAKPSVLRASKKLCARGGVFSLMSAAGGGATNAVAGAGSTMAGAMDAGSAGFISMVAGDTAVVVGAAAAGVNFISVGLNSVAAGVMSVPGIGGASATRVFAVGAEDAVAEDVFAEDAFAVEAAFAGDAFAEAAFALAVEAAESAEAGVDAGEGTPCRSAAKADDPNNAKNIAATATLISLPRRERERARTIEYRLNAGFYWQFLPRNPLVKIGPATELRELRALPEKDTAETRRNRKLVSAAVA
jgi:hypothetical protein